MFDYQGWSHNAVGLGDWGWVIGEVCSPVLIRVPAGIRTSIVVRDAADTGDASVKGQT